MAYTVHYGVLRTGADISLLPVGQCTFGDELRGVGSFDATVPAGQCGNGSLLQATRGGYSFWAVEWSGDYGRQIIAAGPIWSVNGDDDNGLTFGGSGMFSMLGHRKLIDQSWTDAQIPNGVLTYSNLDLGSIIAAIVAQVCSTGAASLPIVYGAPRAGSNTRRYLGSDLAWASDRITEIGNVEQGTAGNGGPDWLFAPQFKGSMTAAVDFTSIEWVLTTGSTATPWLTPSNLITLDKGARGQQNVGKVTVAEDASGLATTAFNVGGGTQGGKIIGSASDPTLTNAGYPRLDADSTSNATSSVDVAAYAAGHLTQQKRTPAGAQVQVRASWWWPQGGAVGTRVRLLDPNNSVLGPVDLTSRVTKWTGDVSSEWVTLTLADSLGGV